MIPRAAWSLLGGVGIVAAITGAVLLTLLAPSNQVGGNVPVTGVAGIGVVVTAPGVAALTGDDVTVGVTGIGPLFVGVARQADLDAWVGDTSVTVVSGLTATDALETRLVTGAGEIPAPARADIWLDSAAADGTVELVVARPAADRALAVVGQGEATLTWQRRVRHPAGWPLGVVGSAVTVLAAVGLARRNAAERRRVAGHPTRRTR